MNWTPLQLALREVRTAYTDWRSLSVIALVGVVAGLAGPFGTFERLAQMPRIAYWLFVAVSTYATGTLFGSAIVRALPEAWPFALRLVIASLGAAFPVTAIVAIANVVVLGDPPSPGSVATLYVYCLFVTVTVLTLSAMLEPRPAGAESANPPEPPPILKRMPPHLRGALRRISTADHYVEIHTDRGMAMALLRFSDALGELGGVPGLQVHRGDWVALDAVRTLKRVDGKPVVELDDGTTLPVSRGQFASVRAALEAR